MKTEFALSKHRFYELKHFCLQYSKWKEIYEKADGWTGKGDTTSKDGITRAQMRTYMDLIEVCAQLVGNDILHFVTEDNISMPPDKQYDYRRFFWELSKRR